MQGQVDTTESEPGSVSSVQACGLEQAEGKAMIVIGIDPGQSGAVAIMQDSPCQFTEPFGWNQLAISLHDTPTIDIGTPKKPRTEYNVPAMAALMPDTSGGSVHAYIEAVHSMPEQGVASSFQFGKGFGIWLGIFGALSIPYTLVTPQCWKKEMLAGRGKEKDASRLRALELFPHLADELQRKKDHNRADALLIAEWGRRQGR